MSEIREVYVNNPIYPNNSYISEWLNVSSSLSLTFTIFEDNNCDVVLDWATDNNYNIINTETTALVGGNSLTIYTPVKNRFVRLSILNIAIQPSVLELQGFHYITSGLNLSHLVNIGGFSGIYKAPNELRTLQSSDGSITITQNADNIDFVAVSDSLWESNTAASGVNYIIQKTPATYNNLLFDDSLSTISFSMKTGAINNVIMNSIEKEINGIGSHNTVIGSSYPYINGDNPLTTFDFNTSIGNSFPHFATVSTSGDYFAQNAAFGSYYPYMELNGTGSLYQCSIFGGNSCSIYTLNSLNNTLYRCNMLGGSNNIIVANGTSLRFCNMIGGYQNEILNSCQNNTIIGGYRLVADTYSGCTLMGDGYIGSAPSKLFASAHNEFSSRFRGGYRLFSNDLFTTGVTLAAGASSWAAVSDINKKEIHGEVDYSSYMDRLEKIPIYEYNYKGNQKEQRSIGPVAQDYHEYFGCELVDTDLVEFIDLEPEKIEKIKGRERVIPARTKKIVKTEKKRAKDDLSIEIMDLLGIALACIKDLNARIKELESRII